MGGDAVISTDFSLDAAGNLILNPVITLVVSPPPPALRARLRSPAPWGRPGGRSAPCAPLLFPAPSCGAALAPALSLIRFAFPRSPRPSRASRRGVHWAGFVIQALSTVAFLYLSKDAHDTKIFHYVTAGCSLCVRRERPERVCHV